MKISSGGYNTDVIDNQPLSIGGLNSGLSNDRQSSLPVADSFADENCEDFFSYLDRLGLANDSKLLVIPSAHHYYYDAEDMKGINTVINLKQLNHVKQVRDFLRTISCLMPHKSNFVGCFVDNKTQNGFSEKYNNLSGSQTGKSEAYENGIESRIPFINRVYSLFDAKTNRYLTRRTVTQLLEECGLQIVGMTELNGLTYFCTRKIHSTAA